MLVSEALLLELSLALDPSLELSALSDAFIASLTKAVPTARFSIVPLAGQNTADCCFFPVPGHGFLQYVGPELQWLPGTQAGFGRVLLMLGRMAEQAQQRQRMQWLHRRSALVAKSAGIGSWEMNQDSLLVSWDSGLCEILEQPEGDAEQNLEEFYARVDPADREELMRQIENFLSTTETESGELSFRILLSGGRSRRLFGKLSWLWNEKHKTLVAALHDVTELELARTESLYRSELESLLTTLSMKLISAPAAEFDQITQQALAEVGDYVGADRAYIFLYDFSAGTASNTHEWCADGIASEIDNLQNTPIDAIDYWVSAHKKGLPLHLRRITDLPENHGLRAILEPQGIQSLIALPLMDESECMGFIGFDAVRTERHWSDIDMSLLKLLAQLLVNAERRFENERTIQKASSKLEIARRNAEELARQAGAASDAKSRFVATISHEIRTPLHAILGFTDMLLDDQDQEHFLDHVSGIKESGESLLALINDVLDFSRIEAANVPLQLADVSLGRILDGTSRMFAALAKQKDISLSFVIAPGCPSFIRVDELRLRQLLNNIVGNAVKFTHRGGVSVHVACIDCASAAPELKITISDTGIGIAPQHIPHLFDSFFQVDSGNDRLYPGTGLGLAIARMLAQLMGGHIAVTSEPGRGTTFTLHLPLEACQTPLEAAAFAPDGSPAEKGLRILFVEDNSVNRQLALIHLKDLECRIVLAENGQKGLESFIAEAFDLVLMDCQMPVMDGYMATKTIRAYEAPRGRYTPIVAVTASAIQGEKELCLAAGMDDVLTKPYSRSEFLAMIARWTQSRSRMT